MNKCYDSLGEAFVCQLEKISCLFASCIYRQYKEKRYGISSCSPLCSTTQLQELKELMEWNELLDLSQFDYNTYRNYLNQSKLQQLVDGGQVAPTALESLNVCNISNLIEKINTL